MKIHLADSFLPDFEQHLAKIGQLSSLEDAEVVIVRSKTKCKGTWFEQAKNVKLIIRGGVGLDNIDLKEAQARNITVKNTAEASTIAVAELAMTLILAAANNIPTLSQGLCNNQWLKKEAQRVELFGKTLGIVGNGRIGQAVAKRAESFGMKVIAYDVVKGLSQTETIEQLIEQVDFVSLHLPSTKETNGIINKTILAKAKPNLIMVNTGRAECINEVDLAEALKNRQILRYASDVWYTDPPKDSPLLKPEIAPYLVVTPHIGAETEENLTRVCSAICGIIKNSN